MALSISNLVAALNNAGFDDSDLPGINDAIIQMRVNILQERLRKLGPAGPVLSTVDQGKVDALVGQINLLRAKLS